MTVAGGAPGGGRRITDEHLAHRSALLVGHHGEVEIDPLDPVEGDHGVGDAGLDLVAERTTGHGERDAHGHDGTVDGHAPDHAEVDDAAVELGVLDRTQGFDDIVLGDWHGGSFGEGGYFSYGGR